MMDEKLKDIADNTVERIGQVISIRSGIGVRFSIYNIILEALQEANTAPQSKVH